ncbi:MAG: peptidase M15 [Prevotella sp.]|nr:peptidase M15 [Prevotella sp.]
MENTNDNTYTFGAPLCDVQLTEHFRLAEFTRSATAIKCGIDNNPHATIIMALQALCINVLEPLRKRFGVLRITSGYRCRLLNEEIGGSRTSQHLLGEAADIHVGSREVAMKMFYYVLNNLPFDQMLVEMKRGKVHCLHISYRQEGPNRRKVSSYYNVKR